jgi:uncharacterized membrane protein YebE (DUF533 family)
MNNAQGQNPQGGNMHADFYRGAGTPPPPPSGTESPPPFSNLSTATPPPPPPAGAVSNADTDKSHDAVLLIRAMIASAAADGYIDAKERQNIIDKLRSVDPNDEELDFIKNELSSPCSIDEIASSVNSPELAKEVYAVSLMAIDMDTEDERSYIERLASKLGLDHNVRDQIHNDLGLKI